METEIALERGKPHCEEVEDGFKPILDEAKPSLEETADVAPQRVSMDSRHQSMSRLNKRKSIPKDGILKKFRAAGLAMLTRQI